jgi:hypothetical protein
MTWSTVSAQVDREANTADTEGLATSLTTARFKRDRLVADDRLEECLPHPSSRLKGR